MTMQWFIRHWAEKLVDEELLSATQQPAVENRENHHPGHGLRAGSNKTLLPAANGQVLTGVAIIQAPSVLKVQKKRGRATVARQPHKLKVVGSIPACASKSF